MMPIMGIIVFFCLDNENNYEPRIIYNVGIPRQDYGRQTPGDLKG